MRTRLTVSRIILSLVVLLLFQQMALSTTRYVHSICTNNITTYNPTGNSGAGACTGGTARVYSSIDNAFSAATTTAGDTLYIRAGTYGGINSNNVVFPVGGTSFSNAPIIAAYPGETVTIGSSNFAFPSGAGQSSSGYLIFDGLNFVPSSGDGLSFWGASTHIRVTNFTVHGARNGAMGVNLQPGNGGGGSNEFINGRVYDNIGALSNPPQSGTTAHGLYIGQPNNTFDNIESYGNGHLGLQIYSDKAPPSGNKIKNSLFHNNGVTYTNSGAGVIIGGGDNNLIYNTVFYGEKEGIQVCCSSTNGQPTNTKIYNNTITESAGVGIELQNGSGTIVRNNIIWNNGGTITGSSTNDHNYTSDPKFVNATSHDYHLQSSSLAINAGTPQVEFVTDKDGISRPQGTEWDIGAYERVLSSPPTVSVTAPANGATVSGPTVTVSANATPSAGTAIVGVQFILDGVDFGAEDLTAPYSLIWNSTTVGNGSHTWRARARDNNSNTGSSAIIGITVNNPSAPPVISGVSAQGITSTGATIVWTTNTASDSQVEYGTTTSYGSSTTLNTALVTSHSQAVSGLSSGVLYHYRVKSKDAAAQLTTSGDFTFTTVDSVAPTVSVTAPANAATVSGATVTVSANASDNVGVVGVTFKRDGGTVIAPEDTTAPYSIVWDSRTVANSTHTLTATARDAQGNTTTSASISVTVDNGAQIYFVTKSGNDSNSCTQAKTIGTAKLTIAAGISCMAAGDTLKIGDGTYVEVINIDGSTGTPLTGTATARTTIQANTINGTTPGVIIAPSSPTALGDAITIYNTSYLSLKGIAVNSANATSSGVRFGGTSSNDLFEDSHVHSGNASGHGIFIPDPTAQSNTIRRAKIYEIGANGNQQGISILSSGTLVEDSEFYSIRGFAIQVYTTTGTISGNILRRNKIRNSPAEVGGITVGADSPGSATQNQVYNNLVYDNVYGISIYNSGSGNKVWNNTVYANSLQGIVVYAGQTSVEVINNIVFQNGTGVQNSGTGTVRNNPTVDPLFVNGAGGDLQLTSGSPARDMGETISAFSTDYLQIVRPVGSAWDIGAYEFVSGPDTTAPMVSISNPLNNAQITSGQNVSVIANASDNVAVAGVQFKLDGGNLGAEDTSAPYSTTWNTTGVASGAHTLTAVARDTASPANTATSAAINVTIVSAPDTTNPTVSITAPAPGATVSGTTVQITANASDNVGVVGVQFKVDNVNAQSEDTTAPYGIIWDSNSVQNGSRSITATARDAAGNTATSTPVTITVNNVGPDTQPPTVSVTNPAAFSTVSGSISITANASDDVGVVGVVFKLDGSPIDGEDLSAPYSLSWNSALVSDGAHIITAVARDAAGNSTTSGDIPITVSNAGPVISGVSAGSITTTAATISWTTSTAADSRVDYGFSTTYTSYNTLGTLSTSHSIPLTGLSPFTQYHYQVSSRDAQARLAQSGDFTFTTASAAPASITVTEPTSSDVWTVNSTVPINWTSANVTGNVRIQISRNNGSTWKTIISSVPVGNGTVNWTGVTNPTTASAKIRVESITNSSIRDDSDAFRIQK